MHYSDWSLLVSGLMNDTPLGKVVEIRCETDKERIKMFTPGERRIRREWQEFLTKQKKPEELQNDIKEFERMFARMFG